MKLTASLGVAAIEPSTVFIDAKSLVRCADHALYEAKRSGKNCVRPFDRKTIQDFLSLKKTS